METGDWMVLMLIILGIGGITGLIWGTVVDSNYKQDLTDKGKLFCSENGGLPYVIDEGTPHPERFCIINQTKYELRFIDDQWRLIR